MSGLTHSMASLFRSNHLNVRCSSSMLAMATLQGQYIRARNSGSRSLVNEGKNDESVDDANKNPKSVPVQVAYQLLRDGHRYLDVRTSEEFCSGHPNGAINIPYMLRNGEDMTKNADFLEDVKSHFRKDEDIVVGCRSGKRSLMAASDLQSFGFTGVTDVAGGYLAWTEKGFPTVK